MTQTLESIVDEIAEDETECPFPHYTKKKGPPNYWTNSSTDLKTNLNKESQNGTELHLPHLEETTVGTGQSGKKNLTMTYNPHHILPGDASWPKTELKKWIDEKEQNWVKADIGYNVNCYENGIDLPSANALRTNWKLEDGRTADFQKRYAFASMDADGMTRQFHDSHKAYNDFVIEMLDKIAAPLDGKPSRQMGCGDEDCSAGKKKPFATPVGLWSRIAGATGRLAKYLYGDCTKWKKPIFTSKFALMYQNRALTHDQARDQLHPDQFQY